MNYKPGTAEFSKTYYHTTERPKNVYEITINVDIMDNKKMQFDVDASKMTELDTLMIAYINHEYWPDVARNEYTVGGRYINQNFRFPKINGRNLLADYVSKRLNQQYHEPYNWYKKKPYNWHEKDFCIQSIWVEFYDDERKHGWCDMPKLNELFDSEKEFIDYVTSIYNL